MKLLPLHIEPVLPGSEEKVVKKVVTGEGKCVLTIKRFEKDWKRNKFNAFVHLRRFHSLCSCDGLNTNYEGSGKVRFKRNVSRLNWHFEPENIIYECARCLERRALQLRETPYYIEREQENWTMHDLRNLITCFAIALWTKGGPKTHVFKREWLQERMRDKVFIPSTNAMNTRKYNQCPPTFVFLGSILPHSFPFLSTYHTYK